MSTLLSRFNEGRARRSRRSDVELEQFRNLLTPPDRFEDGFTWAAFFGAIFVAMLMVPGAIYMTLLAGTGIGPAAQWVTLILMIEVARRANQNLKKSQIFTLFYLAGAIMSAPAAIQGGFEGGLGLLWRQFYAQSNAAHASGIAEHLPQWFSPTDQEVLDRRSFFQWEWLPAIALVIFTTILGRLDNVVLGYGLFRMTSDIERLPFPMAPLGAQGILALSEELEEEKDRGAAVPIGGSDPHSTRWRWRVFSIGGMIGLVFGTVYLGLPTISGALLDRPIVILPIPFVDWTAQTGESLPAVALGISLDLGQVLLGMMLPFFAMLGSFIGLLITVVANPVLYHVGILDSWTTGDSLQATFFKNNVDFYFSLSVGIAGAIAFVGIKSVISGLRRIRRQRLESEEDAGEEGRPLGVPEGRGDIRTKWIIGVYVVTTLMYIGVSGFLIDWHRGVMLVMLFYGFIYTPLISYVSARLEGIAGEVVNIPMVREASFILSGYQGVAVWFLPVPLHNYGMMTVRYREAELTGTSFWSIWKAEVLLVPIILAGSLLFANFIWGFAQVPSAQFPYAQEWWEVTAEQQSIIFSSTLGEYTLFEEALDWRYILAGLGIGGFAFWIMGVMGWPVFLIYGIVRGLNQTLPFGIIPQFVGALIGRYYFQKRLGLVWRQYIPVVVAGFSCGMGLIAMLAIGFTFLARSVFQMPF